MSAMLELPAPLTGIWYEPARGLYHVYVEGRQSGVWTKRRWAFGHLRHRQREMEYEQACERADPGVRPYPQPPPLFRFTLPRRLAMFLVAAGARRGAR